MGRFNLNAGPQIYMLLRNFLLQSALVAVLSMGLVPRGEACAQPLQSTLPRLFNEAAGTGYPGSEIAGTAVGGKEGPVPAITSAIPTAHGADFGDVFSGIAYQRYLGPSVAERNDGAAFLGVGVGNAQNTVGLEITYAIYDLVEDPFSDGSLSLKVHRQLYKGFAIATDMESAVRYGDWVAQSAYAAASQTVQINGGFSRERRRR